MRTWGTFVRAALLAVLATTSMASTGCASTVPLPTEVPTYKIDLLASETSARRGNGENVPSDAATKLRVYGKEILDDMAQARPDLAGAAPARFRATAVGEPHLWPLAACLVVLIYVGCPIQTLEVDVDLVLEVKGKRYEGHGRSNRAVSLYYNLTGYQSFKSAFQAAVEDAVRRSKEKL